MTRPLRSLDVPGLAHKAPIPVGARVGNLICTSAIAGKDARSGELPPDAAAQAALAFHNLQCVLDAGGAPAENARVFLKNVGDDDRIVSEPVTADFMGRFVIAARAGIEYGLFAERARPGSRAGGVDATDTLRLIATDGLAPVRLVLERRY